MPKEASTHARSYRCAHRRTHTHTTALAGTCGDMLRVQWRLATSCLYECCLDSHDPLPTTMNCIRTQRLLSFTSNKALWDWLWITMTPEIGPSCFAKFGPRLNIRLCFLPTTGGAEVLIQMSRFLARAGLVVGVRLVCDIPFSLFTPVWIIYAAVPMQMRPAACYSRVFF